MSNLEKKLWGRKKKSLTCFPIAESGVNQFEPTSGPIYTNERSGATELSEVSEANDKDLLQTYELAKLLFTTQEVYFDSVSNVSFQTFYCPPQDQSKPILIFHHGAGSSSMTFWNFVKMAHEELGYGAFLYDARGHGDTTKSDTFDLNLTLFTDDFVFILKCFLLKFNPSNTICLVGHSLGGSVLTNFLATKYCQEQFPTISGLVVFDIVEDLAIRALISTEAFLQRMPKSFRSYAEAIQWHLDSNLLHNYDSAKVSVFHLMKKDLSGITWKCQLKELPKYWNSWFTGMSKNFIESTNGVVSKLLILSTNETLDKELMIGQMQGKYQLIVFNNSLQTGHFVHEDASRKCMLSVQDFIRRIELSKKMRNGNIWNR